MPNLEQAIQMIQEEETQVMTLTEVNPCDSTASVARYKDGKQQRPIVEGERLTLPKFLYSFSEETRRTIFIAFTAKHGNTQ